MWRMVTSGTCRSRSAKSQLALHCYKPSRSLRRSRLLRHCPYFFTLTSPPPRFSTPLPPSLPLIISWSAFHLSEFPTHSICQFYLRGPGEEDFKKIPLKVLSSRTKICEICISEPTVLTTKLLLAKTPDGRPAFSTLKFLDLSIVYDESPDLPLPLPLSGLCKELEAMAGHNMLESLSLEVNIDGYETEKLIGSIIQKCGEGTGQIWVVCVKTGFL